MSIYILDTNVISDIVAPKPNPNVLKMIDTYQNETLCICEAVDYEVRRGYLKSNATARLHIYDTYIKPQFQWIPITQADWRQAATFWADAVKQGKQLADIDLLVAAVAVRLSGIVVSADNDFDALPITHHNWRLPLP